MDKYMLKDEVKIWLAHPITREFQKRMKEAFEFQIYLQGAELGTSVDRYRGQAEVLQRVLDPESLFQE